MSIPKNKNQEAVVNSGTQKEIITNKEQQTPEEKDRPQHGSSYDKQYDDNDLNGAEGNPENDLDEDGENKYF